MEGNGEIYYKSLTEDSILKLIEIKFNWSTQAIKLEQNDLN